MDETTTPVQAASPRPARRRLVERYSGDRPSTRKEMVRAYNEVYRRNLVKNGIPDRRQLAEATLQAVIEQISTDPDHAKRTLRSAAAILKSVTTPSGKPIFHNEGIKKRIAQVANTLPPAIARQTQTAN